MRIGNKSQGWARAVLDIAVAWDSDLTAVRDVLMSTAEEMAAEDDWAEKITEAPEVWGVEELGSSGVVVRLAVKTAPLEQWKVARELRERVKEAFDREGIAVGVPVVRNAT